MIELQPSRLSSTAKMNEFTEFWSNAPPLFYNNIPPPPQTLCPLPSHSSPSAHDHTEIPLGAVEIPNPLFQNPSGENMDHPELSHHSLMHSGGHFPPPATSHHQLMMGIGPASSAAQLLAAGFPSGFGGFPTPGQSLGSHLNHSAPFVSFNFHAAAAAAVKMEYPNGEEHQQQPIHHDGSGLQQQQPHAMFDLDHHRGPSDQLSTLQNAKPDESLEGMPNLQPLDASTSIATSSAGQQPHDKNGMAPQLSDPLNFMLNNINTHSVAEPSVPIDHSANGGGAAKNRSHDAKSEMVGTAPLCQVCHSGPSNGLHFGAPRTCAACAAFFRRTISDQKKYVCKRPHRCTLRVTDSQGYRKICRNCRMKRCLEIGMLPEKVQHKRHRRDIVSVEGFAKLNPPKMERTPDLLAASHLAASEELARQQYAHQMAAATHHQAFQHQMNETLQSNEVLYHSNPWPLTLNESIS